jgi:hypothetical protein
MPVTRREYRLASSTVIGKMNGFSDEQILAQLQRSCYQLPLVYK